MALEWNAEQKSMILDLAALVIGDENKGLEWLRESIPKVERYSSEFETPVIAQAILLYQTQREPWSDFERRQAQHYFLDWQNSNPSCITKTLSYEKIRVLSDVIPSALGINVSAAKFRMREFGLFVQGDWEDDRSWDIKEQDLLQKEIKYLDGKSVTHRENFRYWQRKVRQQKEKKAG
ncbi:hypothetical protein IFR05_016421 [Cadophora sp. M221]|nr:hypothetical protein IFR05_016421 [Cadophora sp. M221]